MKKVLKFLGYALLAVLALIIGFVIFIQVRGVPHYDVNMPADLIDMKVDVTPERVERGAKIASMTCVQCHLGNDGKLSGKQIADVPKEFGWVHSANITSHPEAGIGKRTDGQLYYMLRTSIRWDGSYVPPYMPTFPRMADEDLKSIIAWLRSGNPMTQPSDIIAPNPRPSFLAKVLTLFAFKPFPYQTKPIVAPDSTDVIAFGKYVANDLYDCYGCHSADFKTYDPLVPEHTVGFYGGGNPLLNLEGETVRSANLTLDPTGIARYTKDEFIQIVRWGKRPDGTMVRYPMTPHTALTDYEAGAIYEYLKTVPHIQNVVQNSLNAQ